MSWSDSEITQKSWPSGAPTRAAAACIAESPGTTRTSTPANAPLPVLGRLEHGGGHREDARVAGGDDRDARAAGGELQRVARALDLDAVVAARGGAGRGRAGTRARYGLVADELVGRGQLGLRLGRQPLRPGRAEPDDRHAAALPVSRPRPCAVRRVGTSTSDMYGHLALDVARAARSARSGALARST